MFNISQKFFKRLHDKKLLIALHRGASAASIIENTSEAAIIGKLQGADIIEADVIRTIDGKYYMFHDGNEKRLLGVEKNIREMTSNEVNSYNFYNEIGDEISKKVEALEDYLKNAPKDVFINIDRSWWYWDNLLDVFDKYESLHEYILFKSPVDKKYLEYLNNHNIKYMYFPIVKSVEDISIIQEYEGINVVGFEIIETSDEYKIIDSKELNDYKEKHDIMVFVNTMKLNDDTKLFGSLDDEKVLFNSPDEVWGTMINLGVNAIQTDWPDILYRYRENKFKNEQ